MVRWMTSDALVRECITECDQGWSWGPRSVASVVIKLVLMSDLLSPWGQLRGVASATFSPSSPHPAFPRPP